MKGTWRRAVLIAMAGLLIALAAWLGLRGRSRWLLRMEGEKAIRDYNTALISAYRANDPRGLEEVAGADEVRKLIALIDLKRASGLVLESQLEALEILSAEAASPGQLTVRTRERWRYWDRPLSQNARPGPVFLADMWMTWNLAKQTGKWKVLQGATDRSEYLLPKGFRPGSTAPRRSPAPAPAEEGGRP